MAIKLIIRNSKAIVKTVADYILNVTGIKDLNTGTSNVSSNKIDWTLQHYTDTAANFTSNNPILLVGQLGIETDGLSTTPKFKIGNGTTAWNILPYSTSGSSLTLEQVLNNGNTTTLDIDSTGIINAESLYAKGTNGAGKIGIKHQSSNPTATGQETVIFAGSDGEPRYKNDGNSVEQLASRTWVNSGLSAKQDTLVSLTNIRTVNGYTLLGSTNLQVGTIFGSVPATLGLIPYANGTSDTVTTNANLSYDNINLRLKIGSSTPFYAMGFDLVNSVAGTSIIPGLSITNTTTSGTAGAMFGETLNDRFTLIKWGTTAAGSYTGTSTINRAGTSSLTTSSGGTSGAGTLVFNVGNLTTIIGSTSTNAGSIFTSTGLRITTLANVHTAGTALLDVDASTTARSSFRIRSGTAPTSPNSGDIWFDGTDLKMRVGATTKTFTLV